MEQCGGGVARNIAEALWRLRAGRARLMTAVADDADGRYLAGIAPGLLLDGCTVRGARTPTYAAVLDARGECLLGLGDMALHNHITPSLVDRHMDALEKAPLVVVDGNVPQPTMDHVLRLCHQLEKPGKIASTYYILPTGGQNPVGIMGILQIIDIMGPLQSKTV